MDEYETANEWQFLQKGLTVVEKAVKNSNNYDKILKVGKVKESSVEKESWRTLLGRTKYVQLEKGITFAMKGVGKERPVDPIERFSHLLLLCHNKNMES